MHDFMWKDLLSDGNLIHNLSMAETQSTCSALHYCHGDS